MRSKSYEYYRERAQPLYTHKCQGGCTKLATEYTVGQNVEYLLPQGAFATSGARALTFMARAPKFGAHSPSIACSDRFRGQNTATSCRFDE